MNAVARSISTAPGTAALRAVGLVKRYGSHDVLAGVDLAVGAGETLGLAGANGAGKTTLIKCVLDLCSADAGAVEIFGVSSRVAAARARLAYLPERFLPPHALHAREFLHMTLALSGGRFDQERVRAQFAELELEADVLDRPVRQLSKGMMQKLGLAACFLVERELYVLDEPMSGLDPATRATVKAALRRLATQGKALFFTSHVLADMEELCGSIAVLDRGRVRFSGTPADLRARTRAPDLERAFLDCIRGGD